MREVPGLDDPVAPGQSMLRRPLPGPAVHSSGPAAYRSIGTPTIEPHSVHEPS
jgi:hypothetical protein